ncbi:hypothetical protein L1887_53945 [Cichorium endivia]|nr:hypothetical protein L1887_53945 [Cichorium endivia]
MSSKAKKLNALAALKAKRDGCRSPLGKHCSALSPDRRHSSSSYSPVHLCFILRPQTSKAGENSDDDAIYDEVSEDEYRSIIRGRVMDDDFIEDDDGSGYVDHGQDEWDQRARANDQDEDEDTEDEQEYFERTGKRKPKKGTKARSKLKGADASSSAYQKSSLSAAFSKQRKASGGLSSDLSASRARDAQRVRSAALDAYRPSVSKEKEDDFMASLMGNLDEFGAQPSTSTHDPASPSPANRLSTSLSKKRKQQEEGAFSRFRTSHSASNGFTSPSSGPPTSESAHPSSDSAAPNVHVSGSDTPPWGPNLGSDPVFELDDELPASNKKLRGPKGLPSRIGSLGLGETDADIFISHPSKRAAGLTNDALAFSDDEAEDLAVRRVEVGSIPAKAVDARGQASRPKQPSPAAATPRPAKPSHGADANKSPSAAPAAIKEQEKTPASRSSWQKVHNDLMKNVEPTHTYSGRSRRRRQDGGRKRNTFGGQGQGF